MKWEEGLLWHEKTDAMGWCFDIGYQVFPVSVGMTMRVRLADRFQQGQVLTVTDDQLTMAFGNQRSWLHTFEQHERVPAKVALKVVQKVLDEARAEELCYAAAVEEQHEHRADNDGEVSF